MGGEKRVGFIGAGKWARVLLKKFVAEGCTVVGHDRRSGLSTPSDPVFGPRIEWHEMVRNVGLDMVVITAGPDVNEEMVRLANSSNVAVLVSKPFLPRQPIVQRVPIYVDLVHQFSPAYARLYDDSRKSKMRSIQVEMCGDGPVRSFSALHDYGPHAFGILCDLAGGRSISVRQAERFEHDGRSNHRISGWLDNSITFKITVGNLATETRRVAEVTFDEGKSVYREQGTTGEHLRFRRIRDAEEETITRFRDHDPLGRLVKNFCDYVRSRTFTDSPLLRTSFRTSALIDEALRLEGGQGV